MRPNQLMLATLVGDVLAMAGMILSMILIGILLFACVRWCLAPYQTYMGADYQTLSDSPSDNELAREINRATQHLCMHLLAVFRSGAGAQVQSTKEQLAAATTIQAAKRGKDARAQVRSQRVAAARAAEAADEPSAGSTLPKGSPPKGAGSTLPKRAAQKGSPLKATSPQKPSTTHPEGVQHPIGVEPAQTAAESAKPAAESAKPAAPAKPAAAAAKPAAESAEPAAPAKPAASGSPPRSTSPQKPSTTHPEGVQYPIGASEIGKPGSGASASDRGDGPSAGLHNDHKQSGPLSNRDKSGRSRTDKPKAKAKAPELSYRAPMSSVAEAPAEQPKPQEQVESAEELRAAQRLAREKMRQKSSSLQSAREARQGPEARGNGANAGEKRITLDETIIGQELALQRLVPEQSPSKLSRQQQEAVAPPHPQRDSTTASSRSSRAAQRAAEMPLASGTRGGSSCSPLSPPSSQGNLVKAEKTAAEEAAAAEKAAAEKAAAKKAAATWQPRYMAVAEELASSPHTWRLPPPAAIPTSSARAPRRREEGLHSANEDPRRGAGLLKDGRLSPILAHELEQNGDILGGEEAAAKKAAAKKAADEKLAAEKAAAEKAAAKKAATEQVPPREWWQPPDWMSVTAKPSGDAGKAEAEKAEAAEAEAAAAAARSPNPLANGTPGRAYNLGSPLANGTPGRAYNLGGYKAPPPSRTKAELEANLESQRQKGRPRPSTTLRLPLSPEPWLGGGSVSPERSEQARSRRLQSKSTWLTSRSDRAESSRPTTETKALGEPSYWSALGWRSWRES